MNWYTEPISPTCQVISADGTICRAKTAMAYKSMGRGFMALCRKHGVKDEYGSEPIKKLLAEGETLKKTL